MKTVILTKGLPGSGKTTWAKEMMAELPGGYKRVNKDDLRAMLDNGRWSRDNEKMVLKVRDAIILQALESGKHVIVDDTNLHSKHYEHIKQLVQGKAHVKVQDFTDVSLRECIENDLKRDRSVGEKVIRSMYNQFVRKIEPIEMDENLPAAYIFDVDGTLARMTDRGPYDWHKVDTDEPNTPVIETARTLAKDFPIIIVTGRDGSCEALTKAWLKKHKIMFTEFHIRPEGNTEKDYIIKQRILEDLITRYNIVGVFDDRNQVVNMWRDYGIACFQVAEGDF